MFNLRPVSMWLRGGTRRTRRPIKAYRFRPSLEALECRLTSSGTVLAGLDLGGNLTILDNAATSTLTLSQPAAGQVTITPDAWQNRSS